MIYATLLLCVGSVVGTDVTAHFVQACTFKWYQMHCADQNSREACNLLVLAGFMYNFQIVSCGLLYDIIRFLCEGLSEETVELILKLVKGMESQDWKSAYRFSLLILMPLCKSSIGFATST
jgi:nucleolar MIF4G domain-containing protein 1